MMHAAFLTVVHHIVSLVLSARSTFREEDKDIACRLAHNPTTSEINLVGFYIRIRSDARKPGASEISLQIQVAGSLFSQFETLPPQQPNSLQISFIAFPQASPFATMAVTEPKRTDTPVENIENMAVEELKTVETKEAIKSTSDQSDTGTGSQQTWSDVTVDSNSGSVSYGSDAGGKMPATKKRRKVKERKNGMRFNIHETFADLRYIDAVDEDGNACKKVMTDRQGNLKYFPNYEKLAAARDKHHNELTSLQLMAIDEILAIQSHPVPGGKAFGVHNYHIIPKSLQGHRNNEENLIYLYAGRHFIIHIAYDIVFDHWQLPSAVSLMKSGAAKGCLWTSANYDQVFKDSK
jgi:hypothetical protein